MSAVATHGARVRGRGPWLMLAAAAVLLLALAAPAVASADGVCRPGLVVGSGESCTYPGTIDEFSVDSAGLGRFLVFTSEGRIEIGATTINGVVYHFAASRQGNGAWLVETVGDPGAPTSPGTAGTSPAGSLETAEGAAVEGRILARRVSDGRVEFGFQPEGAELILPRSRFFPASARVDRWLVSSDVAADGDVLGRITARLLANGRIEFGFNPVAGERILPRGRFFPTTAGVDRWLRSTIIEVRPPRAPQAPQASQQSQASASGPDLVVDTPTVSESAPTAGERFSLRTTVRNQGSERSDSTTLRYYLSSDASVSTADTALDSDYVSRLRASGSSPEWVYLAAPSTAGTYYLGACVDAVPGEADRTNNCSAGVAIAVAAAPTPDLVVDTPTVSDSEPTAGERVRLSATVRNQGTGRSDSTTLRYYQSSDASISTADTELDSDYVSRLSASRTGPEWAYVTAPSTPGTYYYGACVDAVSDEADTTNNCSDAVAVAVGAAPTPDLVVEMLTVSESTPAAGDRLTLRATVRNQGTGRSDSTTLRYYQSADASITTADTELDSDYVSRLSASRTGPEWAYVTAPSTPGTYYYGACVEAVSDEADTTNNCSDAVAVAVGAAPTPDLVVDMPTVSESAPAAGARFRLDATVRNQGSGRADSTTLRYYQSADRSITSGDTELDSDYVSPLSASRTGPEWAYVTAPSTPGTYYYGACVEAVAGELDTTNNCSDAVAVTIGAAPGPTATPTPGPTATPTPGSTGTSAEDREALVALYDATDGPRWRNNANWLSDEPLGSWYGVTTNAGGRVTRLDLTNNQLSGALPAELGRLTELKWLLLSYNELSGAMPAELGRLGKLVTLRITRSQLSGEIPAELGQISSLEGLYLNFNDLSGGIPAELGRLATLREMDLSWNGLSGAVPAALGQLSSLSKLDFSDNDLSGDIPVALAQLSGLEELDLSDNDLDGKVPTELARLTNLEELHLSDNALDGGIPPELGRLSRLRLLYLFGNDLSGTIPAELARLSRLRYLYLARNALSGCVPAALEDVEWNDFGRLGLPFCGAVPDLVVDTPTVSESRPAAGARFTLNATVRNQGAGRSDSTRLRYYRSADASITTGDTEVGNDFVSRLAASASGAESVNLTAPSAAGTYYYGACVEAVSGEADTTNNCSAAVAVTIGATSATFPDPPTRLSATANGQTQIDLAWTAPQSDGGAAITGYRVEVSASGSTWSDLAADTGSTSTSYNHTGLAAGSTRHYRVSAINSVGTSLASTTVSATTDAATVSAPGAPTGLTATANGQTRIDLSWNAPSSNGGAAITGYKIEVSTDGSSWSDLASDTGSTSTSYNHTGLTADSKRYYRVSAINSAGTGSASSAANATTDEKPAADGTCSVGLIVAPGESCTYPGTSTEFSVAASGTGQFLFTSSGTRLVLRNTTINGVSYTFVASKQTDGNWRVEEVN